MGVASGSISPPSLPPASRGDGGGRVGEPGALGWDSFPALGDLPASRHLSPLGEAEFMSGFPRAGDCSWPAHPMPCPKVMATSSISAGFTPRVRTASPWASLWGVMGVSQGTEHPWRTPKPMVQHSQPQVPILASWAAGLVAGDAFPVTHDIPCRSAGLEDTRHSSLPLPSA